EAIGVEDGLPVTLSISGGRLAAPVTISATVSQEQYVATLSRSVIEALGSGSYQVIGHVSDAAGNAATAVRQDLRIAINTSPTTGKVLDGYISGAKVFADLDGDGVLDPGEVSTVSDALGNFSLTVSVGNVVAIGGRDIATNLPLKAILKAPAGATVVNPLTTLVSALVELGAAVSEAQTLVVQRLGIPGSVRLMSYDPLQVAASASASEAQKRDALSVYKASAQIANVLTQTAAALSGAATTLNASDAANAAAASIATLISQSKSTLDLSQASTLSAVLNAAAKTTGTESAVSRVVEQISSVMAATNVTISEVDTASGDFLTALQSVVKAQVVAQKDAAQAITEAVAFGQTEGLLSGFTGAALLSKLSAASVGSIAPGLDLPREQTPQSGGSSGDGVVSGGGSGSSGGSGSGNSGGSSGSSGGSGIGNSGGGSSSGGSSGGGNVISLNPQLNAPPITGQAGATTASTWSVSGVGSNWEYSVDGGRSW
ncbi:MAG: hypothetical protein EBV34_20090, partial [Betaproteobacteria bacterium]|nr:hypothetical protein [Betaproteobacteria bacterium]